MGGYLGDRIPKRLLLGTVLVGTGLSLVLLSTVDWEPLFLLFGALFGLSWGMRTPILGSVFADYFGRSAFGRIAGTAHSVSLPLAIVGPVLTGLVADVSGSYKPAFAMLAVVSVLSASMFFIAHRPREAGQVGSQPPGALS
jgi:MFS family permease